MKKSVMVTLILGILLVSSFIQAQTQYKTYSGFDRFMDNIKLFFSSGDEKVSLALEIREKELNSAIANLESGEESKARKEIELAIKMFEIIRSKTTPTIADKVKENIEKTESEIKENKNLSLDFFEEYLTEEEKTKLFIKYAEKNFEYCKEIAKQDYNLMLEDEKCKNSNFEWLKNELDKEIEEMEKNDSKKIREQMEICMNNPKECNCDKIDLLEERKKCEEKKALVIRCEFQNDKEACEKAEIEIEKKSEREGYEKKILEKYVPGECLEAGVKDGEECKKYIIALNKPESECMENGEVLSDEECEKKLVEENKIPEECIKDGQAVSPEECEKIMKENAGVSSEIQVSLKECVDAGYNTKEKCEEFLLKQNIPQECIDAGALTPEACEKLKLPKDCQGKAFSNEECEAVFIKKEMPAICQQSKEYNFFECAKLLYREVSSISIEGEIEYLESLGISKEDIPDECFKDNGRTIFERDMECDEALIKKFGIMLPPPKNIENIPKPCIKDGTPVSPEECEEILGNQIISVSNELEDTIPEICKEEGVETPEECGELIEEQRLEEGIGINMPEECIGLEVEECKKIMQEKGIEIKKQEKQEVENKEICCKKTEIGKEPRYRWDYEEGCVSSDVQTAEVVDEDFCYAEKDINEDYILTTGVPDECAELGVYDKESCSLIMSKINAERIKEGSRPIVEEDGEVDYITDEQIDKIAEDAEKNLEEIKPDVTKANEVKQEVEAMEDKIKEDELEKEKGVIEEKKESDKEKGFKENKENPESEVKTNVGAGTSKSLEKETKESPEIESNKNNVGGESESTSNSITGEVISSKNEESFFERILKRILKYEKTG